MARATALPASLRDHWPRWTLASLLLLGAASQVRADEHSAAWPPLDDAALAEVRGAGLDPAQGLALMQGHALPLTATDGNPAPAPLSDAQGDLLDTAQAERQAQSLRQFAASTGLQTSVRSTALLTQGVVPLAVAIPVLLPIVGLPLLGVLPALPKPPKG